MNWRKVAKLAWAYEVPQMLFTRRRTPPVPVVAGRAKRRDFTQAESDWMAERAGWRCECVNPRCHNPKRGRIHGGDGRCLADLRAPGVRVQGDHGWAWAAGGDTDPVLNGFAMCGPCNGGKSDSVLPADQLALIAENRRRSR